MNNEEEEEEREEERVNVRKGVTIYEQYNWCNLSAYKVHPPKRVVASLQSPLQSSLLILYKL